MNIRDYFSPCKIETINFPFIPFDESLKSQVTFFCGEENFDLASFNLAIIGVDEDRNSPVNSGSGLAPNAVRPHLNSLRLIEPEVKIVDLGNILGNTVNDKYYALEEALMYLTSLNIVSIVIGGTNEFVKTQIQAIGSVAKETRLKCSLVDSLVDVNCVADGITSLNYLTEILELPLIQTDLTLLGIQKYYLSKHQEFFLENNFVDSYRLRDIRGADISLAETPFRDSSVIGFDVSSILSASMPGFYFSRPNGFTALEACQLGWYAGVSTEIKSFGIYELNPIFDRNGDGCALTAQIIWHFILGYSNKSKQFSLKDVISFQKFDVYLESYDVSLNFYSSSDSQRWWMNVVDDKNVFIVSCDKSDYYMALQGEMPKKWWRYYQRNNKVENNN